MKFTLPISPGYVSHWSLWEAVREIYQNALDETTRDPSCKSSIDYDDGVLKIATTKGRLTPESLVLGNTTKRDDPQQRGKFGEGLKLSLLVLARLGLPVEVITASERWTPRLERDDIFHSAVLNIYVEPANHQEGVVCVIGGITTDQWAAIQRNIRPADEFYSSILETPAERGRIYVGGLFVSTAKEFHCGYAFATRTIKLDRDRGMVDGFDLAYETSKLWTARGTQRAIELLEAEAPDVRYVESHAQQTSPLVMHQAEYFTAKHGPHAVPVSNQQEIERAASAGMKWVLVPETVKSVLRLVKSWFIPTSKSPVNQLREFRQKYEWRLTAEMLRDLDEIIDAMEPQQKAVAA